MIKKIIFVFLATMLTFSLFSCKKDGGADSFVQAEDNPFIGSWVQSFEDIVFTTYEFKEDGTGTIYVMDFTRNFDYEFNDETVTLYVRVDDSTPTLDRIWAYEFNGDALSITEDGEFSVLFKKTDAR